MRRPRLLLLTLVLATAAAVGPAGAQPVRPQTGRPQADRPPVPADETARRTGGVGLDVTGLPLPAALGRAATHLGVGLSYNAALLPAHTATCRTAATDAEAVFACVLGGTGLRAVALTPRLYTLTAAPAPRPLGSLRGLVRDGATGLPVAEASIYIDDGAGGRRSTSTGERGTFVASGLRAGAVRVRVSFVGYDAASVTAEIDSGRVADIGVTLTARPIVVLPVVVDGIQNRRLSEIAPVRDVAGEGADDVAGRLTAVPGVHPGNIVADVHLQGGDAGEHLFRLDGAPVFTPPIVGGLVGAFSPFAIGRLAVQKAGFGANAGSSTVGVIEASHTLPVEDGAQLTVQADVLAAHARLALGGQDASGGRVRAMAAFRGGLGAVLPPPGLTTQLRDWNRTDPFLAAVTADAPVGGSGGDPVAPYLRPLIGGEDPLWRFTDVHLAAELARPDGVRYGASSYVGGRRLDAAPPLVSDDPLRLRDRYTWKTAMVQGRRTAFLGPRALLDVQAYYSQYRLRHTYSLPDSLRGFRPDAPDDDGNTFQESAVRVALLATPSPRLRLDAAIAPAFVSTRLSILNARRQPLRHTSVRLRLPVVASARLRIGPAVEAEAGLRLPAFAAAPTVVAEPRASLRLDLARTPVGAVTARFGGGLYRQFVQQLAVSSISPSSLVSSTRVWMGVDASMRPPLATHVGAEVSVRPGAGVEMRGEAYFKRQFRLHQVDYAADVPLGTGLVDQDQMLLTARGYASGIVGSAEQVFGRASWRLRYEYSLVERQSSLFGSNFYPVPWNEPHRVEALVTARPVPGWSALARFAGVWGRAWGFRRAYYDYVGAYTALVRPTSPDLLGFVERTVQAYDLRNPVAQTLPMWAQVDVGTAYTTHAAGTRLSVRLDLLNVTNRRNVQEYRLVGDPVYYEQVGILRRDTRYGLPITAVMALQATW